MHSDDVMRKKRKHRPGWAVVEDHSKMLVKRCIEHKQVSRQRCRYRWIEMKLRGMEAKKMERRVVVGKE